MSKIIPVTPIRYSDRSRCTVDWRCPRARFYQYEFQGRGIVKGSTSLEFFTGSTLHDSLATMADLEGQNLDIDDLAKTAYMQMYEQLMKAHEGQVVLPEVEEFAKEQATLVEGLIRGFAKHVWPKLMSQYKIVAVEQEMEYELAPGFVFMTKPDLIVEDKEGNLVYIEFKSTSSKKEAWINSWDTQVQLHSSAKAVEKTLGRPISYVQILGLYKGYASYGKQGSIFCYAYGKKGNPPFTQDQISYEYKPGFRRTPTWEMPGGVAKWVEELPEQVLSDQFPMTAPISVNEDLVEGFFRQRLHREREIAEALTDLNGKPFEVTAVMDEVFPQKFDACQPSFGWPCQFKNLCHGSVEDPLEAGFQLRLPHHSQELDQLGL